MPKGKRKNAKVLSRLQASGIIALLVVVSVAFVWWAKLFVPNAMSDLIQGPESYYGTCSVDKGGRRRRYSIWIGNPPVNLGGLSERDYRKLVSNDSFILTGHDGDCKVPVKLEHLRSGYITHIEY